MNSVVLLDVYTVPEGILTIMRFVGFSQVCIVSLYATGILFEDLAFQSHSTHWFHLRY